MDDPTLAQLVASAGVLDDEPAAKRRNRRGEATKDKLVVAATSCFADYGYHRTRISDITDRAGTAQGNFYRHFGNLDEIFLAALEPGLEQLAEASRRTGQGALDEESLVSVSTAYLQAYSRHRSTLSLLREAASASTNDGFQRLWLGLRQQFVARTERWLQRLAGAGEVDPTCDLAMLAELLGCLTEQLAYVHIGLASVAPRRERVEELGRALGQAWYRAIPRAAA